MYSPHNVYVLILTSFLPALDTNPKSVRPVLRLPDHRNRPRGQLVDVGSRVGGHRPIVDLVRRRGWTAGGRAPRPFRIATARLDTAAHSRSGARSATARAEQPQHLFGGDGALLIVRGGRGATRREVRVRT